MRIPVAVVLGLALALPLRAQSAMAACGPLPDSTARQVIKVFDDLRVCLIATKVADTDAELPHERAARGAQVVMETQRPGDNRRASIAGDRVAFTINGAPATIDSMADRWQHATLELLDASFEADALRDQSAGLRTEIDSLPARRASTRARIDLIERKQRELDQQAQRVQAEDGRMNAEIARLERQRQETQSRAAAEERKSMSGDERTRQAAAANAQRLYAEAQRIEQQINGLYAQQQRSDAGRKLAVIRDELRSLNGDNNVALLRMKLANYDSTKVEDLEAALSQLDAPRRLPALEARVQAARQALVAILQARGRAPSR